MLKNNRGQMLLVGIMILVMALILFVATLPAIQSVLDDSRKCNSLNCEGYTDPDAVSGSNCTASNRSHNPDLNENELACTILDLALPLIVMGVLIGLITKLLHGQLVDRPEPQYSYPGGY